MSNVVAEPVKSMVVPENNKLASELPIPIAAEVPKRPPTNPVIATGAPDAYGIIAPNPSSLGGPCGPGGPSGPWGPGGP